MSTPIILNSLVNIDDEAEYKTNRSPYIHNLPFELLDYIFVICGEKVTLGDLYLFPFNVTYVCKQWRDITLLSAKYWSRFEIDNAKSSNIIEKQLALCLLRSTGSPLSFSFTSTFISHKISNIANIVSSEIHRWKNAAIPSTLFLRSGIVDSCTQTLPNLEKLRISGGQDFRIEIYAPNLTHLCLHNVVNPIIPPFLQLGKISHLQLTHCTITMMDLYCLIQRSKNIQNMQLTRVDLIGTYTGAYCEQKVQMKHLTHLTLAMPYNNIMLVLDSIITPGLVVLGLYSLTCHPSTKICKPICTFMEDSHFVLNDLTLWKFPISTFLSSAATLQSITNLQVGQAWQQGEQEMIVDLIKSLPSLAYFTLWYDQAYGDKQFNDLASLLGSAQNLNRNLLKFGAEKDDYCVDSEDFLKSVAKSQAWWV
ncbi:hypothetical protein BDQ17DRAFT_1425945 [Cyathus striatus]|nr:hypothetical protein BDQ17DRAFT_1425945 [Cyathus striatus]